MLTTLVLLLFTIQSCTQMELTLSNLNLSTAQIHSILAEFHTPLVHLTLGFIRGSLAVTNHLVVYNKFEGIPYAAPPIGNRRFKVPSFVP